MYQYLNLINRVIIEGVERGDRTGTGTKSVFGGHIRFDLQKRFPLLQHKLTRFIPAFTEMLWFLTGDMYTEYLHENGVRLWDPWADKRGWVGPIYGTQWRNWRGTTAFDNEMFIDQVKVAIRTIKENPNSRRIVVSAWNVAELEDMCLPPCHFAHQLYVDDDALDMQVYQRSWDLMLGAPFNIAQYALLLHLYARATGKVPRYLNFAFGDAHIYKNHMKGALEMMRRKPLIDRCQLVFLTDNTDIDEYRIQDFAIEGYKPEAFIKLEVAI